MYVVLYNSIDVISGYDPVPSKLRPIEIILFQPCLAIFKNVAYSLDPDHQNMHYNTAQSFG